LVEFGKQFCNSERTWCDVAGNHDDLKLRIQACKFCLFIPASCNTQTENRQKVRELLQLHDTCTQDLLRRRFFQLACHYFTATATGTNDELAKRLLEELDAASRPVRSLDDRLMVIDCLTDLDLQFLKDNSTVITVILIRLLTDLEDIVRDDATSLLSRKFNNSDNSIQSGLAMFTCVARLLSEKSSGDGKRALCGYLLEIVEEFDKTLEDNSADERIFDKNEANYNLEPFLIVEWLRILSTEEISDPLDSELGIMALIDRCLSLDALNYGICHFSLRSDYRETVCQVLRGVVGRYSEH